MLPAAIAGGPTMWHICRMILSTALVMTLAIPAVAADEDPLPPKPSALVGSSLTWCPEVPAVEAEPSLFRDRPIYLGFGDRPEGKLRRWAERRPGYAGLWVADDNLGWIVVAFTQDVDKRQAAIERRFPDLGAVAVEVEHSLADLKQVHRRIAREVLPLLDRPSLFEPPGPTNIVHLGVDILTDEVVALLEPLIGDDPVCVWGRDPSWLVPDGPQPTEGDGWTLVGHRQGSSGPYFRTGLASDREQFGALWAEAGMEGEAPEADLIGNVVIWFAEPHGSTCDLLRLDDVVIDHDRALIHPLIVLPDDPMICTDDLRGAYQYLVAVERARLPAAPFAIQLDPDRSYEDRVVVEADLRAPGSMAADDEIAHRPLPERRRKALRSGGITEVGYRWPYIMDVRCGVGYLGELNDIHWVSKKRAVPGAWLPKVDEDGEIIVSVLLKGGKDPSATARAAGHTIRYEPRREAPSSMCDS